MGQAKNITIVTIASALTFCALIVFASLTPLANLRNNANQFNSPEMWLSIAFILTTYIIPLMLFYIYPKLGKVILAIFCGIGILMFLTSIPVFVLLGVILEMLPSLISVLIICAIGVIINIVWFVVAYSCKQSQPDQLSYNK